MTLLVFADDWGRHPSSCQHLVSELVSRHQVGWVNTIGTRPPRLDLATVCRGLEKIGHWVRVRHPEARLPANLHLLQPRMWPWMTRRGDRHLNRWLLRRQLLPWVEQHAPVVGITTLPIVADLMDVLPVEWWVYYCVDDFSQWPGLDQRALEEMEREVIEKADAIVAAGQELQQRLSLFRDDVQLLTHGVDIRLWQNGCVLPPPTEIAQTEPPRIVFWGLIDRRMDMDFLCALSERLTRGTICLVGPQQNPDPGLWSLPRVRHVPPMDFGRLPAVATAAEVLIMPYADLPVTRAMQPLKLLEYLATGKPVVVRDLPATRPWSDCLDAATGADEFATIVCDRLASGIRTDQASARRRLADESWHAKSMAFERMALFPSPTLPPCCCG